MGRPARFRLPRAHRGRRNTLTPVPPSLPSEAVVRGHRAGLLRAADYSALFQCETLDDVKLNLVKEGEGGGGVAAGGEMRHPRAAA